MRTKILQILISAIMAIGLFPVIASAQQVEMPSFNSPLFQRTWKADDLAVLNGEVARSWTWGNAFPSAAHVTTEPYKEAPGGMRTVQYFDKSRMEDASWRVDASDKWAVTNGLLVVELVTGKMQLGDNTFVKCTPADIPVAGDLDQHGDDVLYYSTFYNDINPGGNDWAPEFQEFMSRDNATYKVGLASSPAWWTKAKVGGTMKKVLVQLGERRALTYTPSNPDGWKVEWGNVGLHYYNWRYGASGCEGQQDTGQQPTPAPAPTVPDATAPQVCNFPQPGNLDDMPKGVIEDADINEWFHRVYNPNLFHAPNWDGADSWFVTLALGPNSGGRWIDHGNPGQIVYRGTETHISWCLGVLTTSKYMQEFLAGASGPVAINIRIAPHSIVSVKTASGQIVSQATSDMGDITIILPDDNVVAIAVDYTTQAPTHESLVWWGPYDRSESINTIDAR